MLGGDESKLLYFKDQTAEQTRRSPPRGSFHISGNSKAVSIESCKHHSDQSLLQPYRKTDPKFEVMQGATKRSLDKVDKCPNRSTIFVVYPEPPFGSFKEPPFLEAGPTTQGECSCCKPVSALITETGKKIKTPMKVLKDVGQFCAYCERLVCTSCIKHDAKNKAITRCSMCIQFRRP